MADILFFIAALALIILVLIGLGFFVSCIWEKEKRATLFAGMQLLGMIALVVVLFFLKGIGFFDTDIGIILLTAGLVFGAFILYLLIRRIGLNPKALEGTKGLIVGTVIRSDEREIVFARNRSLRPGSEQYEAFYREHPEYRDYDDKRREKGGPLGHPGTIDNPNQRPNVSATMASLSIPFHLSTPPIVNPPAFPEFRGEKMDLSPEEATERVKGYALNIGSDLVGITEINPLWVYSRRGEIFHENWEDWGREIELTHQYAVVFAMEMSFRMIGAAPHSPTMAESMNNYAKGAFIATQLAAFVANLGYSSTANHLRHYDAVLVPLAVDAGLGELSRMGYLITKEYGPRVRLGAVTTDLPLIPDDPVDIGVEDFCRSCKKCAVCCPSSSIPLGDREEVNGTLRWKLNEQTCFEYWGKVGTDCNVCMRVCPWGHARTFPHKLIVECVSRNRLSRRIFSAMDDIFYGKRPKPKAPPGWARFDKAELYKG
jgi:reductive dehalogenase